SLFVLAALGPVLGLGLALFTPEAAAATVVNLNTGVAGGSVYAGTFFANAASDAATSVATIPPAPAPPPPAADSLAFLTTVVGPNGPAPIPPWIPNDATSQWIGPGNHGQADPVLNPALAASTHFKAGYTAATGSAPQGFYYYTTTFTLDALGPGLV